MRSRLCDGDRYWLTYPGVPLTPHLGTDWLEQQQRTIWDGHHRFEFTNVRMNVLPKLAKGEMKCLEE